MMLNPPTAVFSTDEASEYLRLSLSHLAKMRMRGEGPAFCKVGNKILYRREALERWLAEREHRSTSEYEAA